MNTRRPLKELISAWLDLTKDQPPPLGISVEEARRRARELRHQLRQGTPPALGELDEDSKDILFALVQLVCDEPPLPSPAEAARLYRFIEQSSWDLDEFGQKEQLLARCKEIAGTALSLKLPGQEPCPVSADRGPEATKIFDDAATSIRLSLLSIYKMSPPEVEQAEGNLRAWFTRFCQRPATSSNLRRALFSGCAQLASRFALKRQPKRERHNLVDYRPTARDSD